MGFQKKETPAPKKSFDASIRPLITGPHAIAVDRLAKAVNLTVPAVVTELIAAAFARGLDCMSFTIEPGTPLVSNETVTIQPEQPNETPAAQKKAGHGKNTPAEAVIDEPIIDLAMPKI
jgi:hypothetical protein